VVLYTLTFMFLAGGRAEDSEPNGLLTTDNLFFLLQSI
jgi:hypothetical protein